MSLRNIFTRLFRRNPAPLSTRDVAADEIERRARARIRAPLDAACRANGLSNDERRRVYAAFAALASTEGLAEARTHACNLAAVMASQRRAKARRNADPWQPTPPAAAA